MQGSRAVGTLVPMSLKPCAEGAVPETCDGLVAILRPMNRRVAVDLGVDRVPVANSASDTLSH